MLGVQFAPTSKDVGIFILRLSMKDRDLYLPNDFFNAFPTEQVKASELKPGDIFKRNSQYSQAWEMAISSEKDNYYNNGYDWKVSTLSAHGGGGGQYFHPDEEVTVILRSLINQEVVDKLIKRADFEEKRREKWRHQEEEEERERLREMRDRLNRELGED